MYIFLKYGLNGIDGCRYVVLFFIIICLEVNVSSNGAKRTSLCRKTARVYYFFFFFLFKVNKKKIIIIEKRPTFRTSKCPPSTVFSPSLYAEMFIDVLSIVLWTLRNITIFEKRIDPIARACLKHFNKPTTTSASRGKTTGKPASLKLTIFFFNWNLYF